MQAAQLRDARLIRLHGAGCPTLNVPAQTTAFFGDQPVQTFNVHCSSLSLLTSLAQAARR
jgi:hypothetical protein